MYLFTFALSIELTFHASSSSLFVVSYKDVGETHYEQV